MQKLIFSCTYYFMVNSRDNLVIMRLFLLPLILLIYSGSFCQCKTYKISSKGDTLNCTDFKGIKSGQWVVRAEALRAARHQLSDNRQPAIGLRSEAPARHLAAGAGFVRNDSRECREYAAAL